MNKEDHLPAKFESLTDLHRVFSLPKPLHPLISFTAIQDIKIDRAELPDFMMLNFYKVVYKTNVAGQVKYGQNSYDFGEVARLFSTQPVI